MDDEINDSRYDSTVTNSSCDHGTPVPCGALTWRHVREPRDIALRATVAAGTLATGTGLACLTSAEPSYAAASTPPCSSALSAAPCHGQP